MTHRLRVEFDSGFTLVEVLVAVVIMAVATVSIVGAMTSTFSLTEQHRGNASTDTVARSFEEAIQQKQANLTAATFLPCPTVANLTPTFSVPNFTTTVTGVEYWLPTAPLTGQFDASQGDCLNGNSGIGWAGYLPLCQQAEGSSCPSGGSLPLSAICPPCDPGVERVTIKVVAQDAALRGTQFTTQFMVRRGNVGATS